MPDFKMRTSKPEAGNKYYIRKADGGWSPCITGKPKDAVCNVLSNCVGYAVGRFNEIGGYGECRYLKSVNAENFIQYRGSCQVSQEPSLGAVMVWQKGASLSEADGAGHVAIVERVDSDTQVYTSESGYGTSAFWNQTRKKGDGNWGMGSSYKFLGFIVNPAISSQEAPADAKSEFTSYVVAKGDTLSRVAAQYGTTYLFLAKINNIQDPNKIYVGQVLKVPQKLGASTMATQPPAVASKVLVAGLTVVLKSEPLYASSSSTKPANKKSGTFYIWGPEVIKGRVRVTNQKNRVGVAGQVTGWIDVSTIK